MTSFDCTGDGFSIMDPEVDDMHGAYDNANSAFYVVEEDGAVMGVGGIGPLIGGDADTCELKKMYFLPELRGKGQGKALMEVCLKAAKELGYQKCYLETVKRMIAANGLYQKYGFKPLDSPRGGTGHNGCDSFYIKYL